jgi:hypothetical protein
MPTSSLLETPPALLTADRPATLGTMLRALSWRADLLVMTRPAALAAGAKVKA